jgi:hypothetical protein
MILILHTGAEPVEYDALRNLPYSRCNIYSCPHPALETPST